MQKQIQSKRNILYLNFFYFDMKLESLTPILYTEDIETTIQFYATHENKKTATRLAVFLLRIFQLS
jgi:hypothetical protein